MTSKKQELGKVLSKLVILFNRTTHFNGKHVSVQGIITHLKFHIFTSTTTFHRSPFRNHNLKVVNNKDIIVCLLRYAMMNEIMGISIVD